MAHALVRAASALVPTPGVAKRRSPRWVRRSYWISLLFTFLGAAVFSTIRGHKGARSAGGGDRNLLRRGIGGGDSGDERVLLVFCYLIVPSVGAMLYAENIGPRLAIG